MGPAVPTTHYMTDFKTVLALSVLALLLVGGVIVAATVNPYILLGLGPVLLAVAAVISAVRGGQRRRSRRSPQR